MYEMKTEYYTGIKQIDEEHEKLFAIAESAYQLMQQQYLADKYDHIKAVLIELRDYAMFHFADEEAYMESINYKKIFSQKIQHQNFINKLEDFNLDKLEDDNDAFILEILEFLTDWLVHHILEMDVLIGK